MGGQKIVRTARKHAVIAREDRPHLGSPWLQQPEAEVIAWPWARVCPPHVTALKVVISFCCLLVVREKETS